MLMSAWSSDLCSCDLARHRPRRLNAHRQAGWNGTIADARRTAADKLDTLAGKCRAGKRRLLQRPLHRRDERRLGLSSHLFGSREDHAVGVEQHEGAGVAVLAVRKHAGPEQNYRASRREMVWRTVRIKVV